MDWKALELTLWLAAATCLVITPVALVLGRWLAWSRFPGRNLVQSLLLLPLVLPPTVLGYYLLVVFAPNSWAGQAFAAMTGGPLAFSFAGVLLASLIINLPFAVQPLQQAFDAVPGQLREAAWVSGLSSWETFLKVELPLAWPGLVSALALVFAHTLGEFGVILMIGGNIPGETQVLSISIYDRVQAFRNDEAGVMAAALLAISFVAVALVQVTGHRRRSLYGT